MAQLWIVRWLHTMTSAKPQISDWARYPASVVVAFIASVITGILYGMLCFGILDTTPVLSIVLPLFFAPLVGFNGVFFGSLCFQRSKRVFGSVLLLVLGLGFYLFFIGTATTARGESFSLGGVFMTAIGGAAAIALCYWRQPPNTSLQPTAAAPSASDEPGNPKSDEESASPSGGCG